MLRKYIKATVYVVFTAFLVGLVISCEEDFTDIGTSIVNNGEFTTNDTIFEIEISAKNIEKVQADGLSIGGLLGQYLLGVHNNNNYKKIEASIVSQLGIPLDLTKVDYSQIPQHDVLCAGFPCQPFSKAGKRKGMKDPLNGFLFNSIIEIIDSARKKPNFLILEIFLKFSHPMQKTIN